MSQVRYSIWPVTLNKKGRANMTINNDYIATPNSVPACKMSLLQFKEMMRNALDAVPEDFQGDSDDFEEDYSPLLTCMDELDGITLTVPYVHNNENASAIDYNEYLSGVSLLGFHMLSNGVPIFGMYAGSDYAPPAVYIFYPDANEQLAIYVPVRGNAVNLANNAFIGEDAGIVNMDDETYMQQYGFDLGTLVLDCD